MLCIKVWNLYQIGERVCVWKREIEKDRKRRYIDRDRKREIKKKRERKRERERVREREEVIGRKTDRELKGEIVKSWAIWLFRHYS